MDEDAVAQPSAAELLAAIARAALGRQLFEDKLLRAIRNAHDKGQPLRSIAEAAGISHEQVRRLLRRNEGM